MQDNKDPIENAIGQWGKWQIWVCGVIFLMKFPVAWHQMSIIFLAPPIKAECVTPNITDVCSTDCINIQYDRSVFTETIITQWDLICEKAQLANIAQTITMLGILVGNVFFGIASDKYGRRITLVVAVLIQLTAGILNAFTPWFWVFCIFRFITGFATGGTMITGFVVVMEITGPKYREIVSILYQIPFNIGHVSLAAFGYYFRNWQHFQFAISIPSIILISYYWLIPESPRWLFTTGKLEKASEILVKAAKQNKLPTEKILANLEEAANNKAKNVHPKSKGNAFDLLRTPNMRAKTICISFNWFVAGLAFFGLSQYMGQVGGDIFSNVAIGACLTLPGTIISIFMVKYLGRKLSLILSNALTGIAMICIAFVPSDMQWLVVTLASAGIFGMSVTFPNVYLFGGELFPTVVRNAGIGGASMIARFGSMAAPFVASSATSVYWLPPVIFGIIPLIGALLVLRLPETKGYALPETIEDGENFGKKIIKTDLPNA